MDFKTIYTIYYCVFIDILMFHNINLSTSTSDINPYKDIQRILSEDFNPHIPKAEINVLPWRMNYSYKETKILEFKDIKDFPLHEICKCSLEEVNEMESNIVFGSGAV